MVIDVIRERNIFVFFTISLQR